MAPLVGVGDDAGFEGMGAHQSALSDTGVVRLVERFPMGRTKMR